MKILVAHDIPRAAFANMPADWTVTFPEENTVRFSEQELIDRIADYDVLLSFFTDPLPNSVIDAGKNLKLISNFGAGFNNIDIAYARKKGIAVTNTPGAVCNPTAEEAIGLMLALVRRIGEMNIKLRLQKEELWKTNLMGHTLEGKTLGILGMGRIGREVARKAEVFGMHIIYCNRRTEVPGYKRVDMDTLLRTADIVSIHVPLNAENRHLVNAAQIAKMKPTAYLINNSRGAVIDEEALACALEEGKIAGAALDVFENEPTVNEKLYNLSNAVIVPHLGVATYETREATAAEALRNIINFFAHTPSNIVN